MNKIAARWIKSSFGKQYSKKVVQINSGKFAIEDVAKVAESKSDIRMQTEDKKFFDKFNASRIQLEKKLKNIEYPLYGINTCVGESCTQIISNDKIEIFQTNLVESHQMGLGKQYSQEEIRASLVVRIIQLTRGFSSVSQGLINTVIDMLNNNVLPCIPQQGSLGASGDLIPMSYLAGAVQGTKSARVTYKGKQMLASDFWENHASKLNMKAHKLLPKEGLAIMNGTPVGCAIVSLELPKIENLIHLSALLTGMASNVMRGNPFHFDKRIYEIKPYPGMVKYAKKVRMFHDHINEKKNEYADRCQQRYSVRCSPHIVGVSIDVIDSIVRPWLTTEINSATDNPLIDPENGDVLHGGNFYGGHLGFVCDSLKQCVGNLCDIHDRQIASVLDPVINNGLPPNLVDHNHSPGFKPFTLCSPSLAAEAQHLVQPMSIFSRSSESHNQDKVPMSTTSARQLRKLVNISEKILALNLVTVAQAIDVRLKQKDSEEDVIVPLHERSLQIRNFVRDELKVPFIGNTDVGLEKPLNNVINSIRNGDFNKFC